MRFGRIRTVCDTDRKLYVIFVYDDRKSYILFLVFIVTKKNLEITKEWFNLLTFSMVS